MSRPVLVVAAFLLMARIPLHGDPTVAAQQPTAHTFRELGFGDQSARSMYGRLEYFFAVPAGRLPGPEARIELVYSHSPLLASDRSTMTVTVNGQSMASITLTEQNRERSRLAVPLPAAGFAADGFFVQVAFNLRLTRDECEEARNPALWATVHGDSLLVLPTQPSPDGADLADLSRLLVPAEGAAAPLAMALPSSAPPEVLRAAGLAAFQYGRWAGAAGRDPLLEAGPSLPSTARAGVIVGTGDALGGREPAGGLRWDGAAFFGASGAVPAAYGVLAVARSEPPALVVSGATPAAVLAAAEALVQPERRDRLAGPAAIVTGMPVAFEDAGRPWRHGAASFAQLGAQRREFAGAGLHSARLDFERPPGWVLEDGAELALAIESATAVRKETSWVAARVNGIDVGTRRLAPDTAGVGRYTFPLPAEQLTADLDGQPQRRLTLEVEVYLDVPEAGCIAATPEAARAALLPSSAWRLPHHEYTGQDLGRFPLMFFRGQRAPVTVVLPDRPGAGELSAGLTLMAALGRWSGSDDATWPHLVTAGALTDEERGGHLILLGGPAQNAVSAAAREKDRTLFKDAIPPIEPAAAGGTAAALQLIRSPWGRGRALLAVSGDGAEAMRLGAEALATARTLARVRGRTVSVSLGLPPQTVAGADPAESPPTDLAPRVRTPFRNRIEPWQVVGAVLLGAFVATVGLMLYFRLRGHVRR